MAELILDKCKGKLSSKDAGEILNIRCSFGRFIFDGAADSVVQLLTKEYPDMDISCVGAALVFLTEKRAPVKTMAFLFENFPEIREEDRVKALLKASQKKNEKVIELIEQYTPGIVEKNLDAIFSNAVTTQGSQILL